MREKWRIFRERWPFLPWTWKAAIVGFTVVCILETIRTVVNLLQGKYF
jgi:hypothetical protein